MKLTSLHEASIAGYGMAYQILGAKPKELIPDLFQPRGVDRWYYRDSPLTLNHIETKETEFPVNEKITSTLVEGHDAAVQRIRVPVGFIEGELVLLRRDDKLTGFWDLTEDAYNKIKDDPSEQTHLLHAAARILYAIVEWGDGEWKHAKGGYIREMDIHDHNTAPTIGQVIGLGSGYTAALCDGGPECSDAAH